MYKLGSLEYALVIEKLLKDRKYRKGLLFKWSYK
jgi:hypothetical protein